MIEKGNMLSKKKYFIKLFLVFSLGLLSSILIFGQEVDKINDVDNSYIPIPKNTIINLYDAFGESNDDMQKDFGFSCIVNYNGTIILFDGGTNADIFRKNIEALKIDLTKIDFAVASHAHFDHINGFDYLLKVNPNIKIYFPFDLFWGANIPFDISGTDSTAVHSLEKRMQYFDGDFQSYSFDQSGRFWRSNIEFVKGNTSLASGINLIVTSSPYMGYFMKYPNLNLENEGFELDKSASNNATLIELPELSLSLKTEEGEVLIVGCSHSTVEKIVRETKSFSDEEISLLYGGYHLLPYDAEILTKLAIKLKTELKVKKVAPAHCTGHLAFKILQDNFKENYFFAGLGEKVEF